MFGIYKVKGTDEYRFFITDSERGISCYSKSAATEEEACEHLIDMARKGKACDKGKVFENRYILEHKVQECSNRAI